MNFSKNLAIVVLILLAINSIVASLLRLICVFWIPILFVDFAIYIGISACINLVILLAITSIAVWEIIKKILRWSEQKKEEMELADREAEEFFYQMQNISVDGDADRDFLKGAIREIVSDILLEKNIINRQELEQQVNEILKQVRKDREIDDVQVYMVVRIAVQEALKEMKIA